MGYGKSAVHLKAKRGPWEQVEYSSGAAQKDSKGTAGATKSEQLRKPSPAGQGR